MSNVKTEQTNKAPKISKPVTPQGAITRYKAISMKPPYYEEVPGSKDKRFYLIAILENSGQKYLECTKEVWTQVERRKLDRELYMDFILYTAPGSDIINQIDVVNKQSPDGQDYAREASSSNEANILIFSYDPDGTVTLRYKPSTVSPDISDSIMRELGNLTSIKEQDIILDRYRITEIRQDKYIYVDPNEI